jgi:hypothetical protein
MLSDGPMAADGRVLRPPFTPTPHGTCERHLEHAMAAAREQLRATSPTRQRVPVPQGVDLEPPRSARDDAQLEGAHGLVKVRLLHAPLTKPAHAAPARGAIASRLKPSSLDIAPFHSPLICNPALHRGEEHVAVHLWGRGAVVSTRMQGRSSGGYQCAACGAVVSTRMQGRSSGGYQRDGSGRRCTSALIESKRSLSIAIWRRTCGEGNRAPW